MRGRTAAAGDDTQYFSDQRGKFSGSGCNGLHTI